MKKNFLFIILCTLFSLTAKSNTATTVSIQVINLPDGLEGQSIAFVGNLNGWNNTTAVAQVTGHTLSYYFDSPTLTALTSEWIDAPAGANAGFRFVASSTWNNKVIAYFQTNDGNFRLALNENMNNLVVIDAKNEAVPILDQDKCVTVNGVCNDNTPMNRIDPTRFSFPGGKWKALIMGYDDGGYQDRTLVGIFNTYNIIGSFFLNSGLLGNSDKITSGEVATLYGNNEVGLHTVSHPYLESLNDYDLYHQIADCQSVISGLVGYKVTGMAYPFGTYDKRTLKILNDLGIAYSRTTINTYSLDIPYDLPGDLLRWNPTCHDSQGDYWATQLINWDKQQMALLFLWGHSWEHTSDWTSLTNLCAKLSNKSDIWYAKAWSVAHYLTAVSNIIRIGDNGYYNPSKDVSVWVKTIDGIKELKPLQTISDVFYKSDTSSVIKICPEAGSGVRQSDISGSNYQWQVNTGNGNFTDLTDNTNFSGTQTATLHFNSLPSSYYGYQYRCVADGAYSKVFNLSFSTTWTGAVDSLWENPANWNCGSIPDANTDVFIDKGKVSLNSNTTIRSLAAQPGAKVTISNNYRFTILH